MMESMESKKITEMNGTGKVTVTGSCVLIQKYHHVSTQRASGGQTAFSLTGKNFVSLTIRW